MMNVVIFLSLISLIIILVVGVLACHEDTGLIMA